MESRINHPEDYLSSTSGEDDAEGDSYDKIMGEYDMEYPELGELGVGLGQVGVERSALGVGIVDLEGLEEDLQMDNLYDLADLDVDDVDW